jgi:hypothetical protein
MKFTKEFLQDDGGETVYDKMIGRRRWSIDWERVFKHEGRFYRTLYSVGSTESQDERPYEYEGDEIECVEVFPQEKTITVYVDAAGR